jgi:hypothetical protein
MTQTVRDELRLEYFNKFGDETNEKMHEQFDWFITKMEAREEKILNRVNELKALHTGILKKHEEHRQIYKRNSDSIMAKNAVLSDENSGYACEVWGRLNELENLVGQFNIKSTKLNKEKHE